VGQVDDHAELVHAVDDLDAEIGQPGVGALGAAVAQEIARVVGELNAARARRMKLVQMADVALDDGGVLKSEQDADASGGLRLLDIGRLRDFHQPIRKPIEARVPRREILHRHREVAIREARVNSRHAARLEPGEHGICLVPILVGRQRVDDRGLLEERVDRRACRDLARPADDGGGIRGEARDTQRGARDVEEPAAIHERVISRIGVEWRPHRRWPWPE
jgi:hypothetical protein